MAPKVALSLPPPHVLQDLISPIFSHAFDGVDFQASQRPMQRILKQWLGPSMWKRPWPGNDNTRDRSALGAGLSNHPTCIPLHGGLHLARGVPKHQQSWHCQAFVEHPAHI